MSRKGPLTFFITGASSGIGLALSRAAADRGDNVIAIARSVEAVAELAEEHPSRVLRLACDVRDETQVETRSRRPSAVSAGSMSCTTTLGTACSAPSKK